MTESFEPKTESLPRPAYPAAGVPPRPTPLPPPRPISREAPASRGAPGVAAGLPSRPIASRPRKARLTLRRVDPWSVFLSSIVASVFVGIALLVAVAILYAVLSKLGVVGSVNKLIGDVTSEPGSTSPPAPFFSAGKVMTGAMLVAALDVVLLTALATLGAFLYNLCAALTGGVEVTLSERD